MGRCALHQKCRGAGIFTAGGKPLKHPRHHNQQRCTHADRGVVRREGDQRDGHGHQPDNQLHRGFAAFAVGINTQQDAAHRTHEKAHAKGGQGHQQRRVFVFRGEELPGDDTGEKAVDDKVIPFQRVADHGRHHLAGAGNARL